MLGTALGMLGWVRTGEERGFQTNHLVLTSSGKKKQDVCVCAICLVDCFFWFLFFVFACQFPSR